MRQAGPTGIRIAVAVASPAGTKQSSARSVVLVPIVLTLRRPTTGST